MDSKVIDWKVVVALGGTSVFFILALRMNQSDAKDAFNQLVDVAMECAVALSDKQ
jgi:hypothetical protein